MTYKKLPIPQPLTLSNPSTHETQNVAVAIRGVGITNNKISFFLQVLAAEKACTQEVVANFGLGKPFAMPHQVPDPNALTVASRWKHDQTPHDWTIPASRSRDGRGHSESGAWALIHHLGVWEFSSTFGYDLETTKTQEFEITVSWLELDLQPHTFTITEQDFKKATS